MVYVCVQMCVILVYACVCARMWTGRGRNAGIILVCMYVCERESERENARASERERERERDARATRDTLGEKSTKILD